MSDSRHSAPGPGVLETSFIIDEKRRVRKYLSKIITAEQCGKRKSTHPEKVKDAKKSEHLRSEGNKIFRSRITHSSEEHLNIWKLYSESIAVAPSFSEELALSFSNRSELLLHLKKYVESIGDIDRAWECECTDFLKVKLLYRKAKCLTKIADPSVNDFFNTSIAMVRKLSLRKITKKMFFWKFVKLKENYNKPPEEKVPETKAKRSRVKRNSNNYLAILSKSMRVLNNSIEIEFQKNIPCASTAIAVKYNDTFGRHIVSTRKIKPDEILVVEKGYCACLKFSAIYTHCSHCSKVAWASIPCENCSYAMYCSKECKHNAWERYHSIECRIIDKLYEKVNNEEWSIDVIFSTRLMIQALKENDEDIFKLEESLKCIDDCKDHCRRGFTRGGTFDSSSFESAFSLLSNAHNESEEVLHDFSKCSAEAVYWLAKCTKVFEKSSTVSYSDILSLPVHKDLQFIGALISRMHHTVHMNQFALEEQIDSMPRRTWSVYDNHASDDLGSVIAPFCGYVNHSCLSNVATCCTDDGKVILYSITTIDEGAQVFTSYWKYPLDTPDFLKEERMSQRLISCNCKVCEGVWPPLSEAPLLREIIKDSSMLRTMRLVHEELDQLITKKKKVRKMSATPIKEGIARAMVAECLEQMVEKNSVPCFEYYKLMNDLCHFYLVFYGKWFQVPGPCR